MTALIGCYSKYADNISTITDPVYTEFDYDISAMPEDEEKYKLISDLIWEPEKHEGQIIKVTGKAYTHFEAEFQKKSHMCLTTWADGEEPEGFFYVTANGKYPEDGKMITVTGMLMTYEETINDIPVTITELREANVEEEK